MFHGGAAYGPKESALRSGLDILVATPGRVIDHLQRGNLDLGQVQHAVLDEADEMLNMGFADDIESIFSYINVSGGGQARRGAMLSLWLWCVESREMGGVEKLCVSFVLRLVAVVLEVFSCSFFLSFWTDCSCSFNFLI